MSSSSSGRCACRRTRSLCIFVIDLERSADAPGGAANAFFPGEMARYWRELYVSEELSGKKLLLEMDGAYMNAEVSINDMQIDHHPYGYTPWRFDLTPYVRDGYNLISVDVQSRQPSTHWYSGGGIFREVKLLVGDKICINPWDLFITTPKVSKTSAVHITAQIENAYADNKCVAVEVSIAPKGKPGHSSQRIRVSSEGQRKD